MYSLTFHPEFKYGALYALRFLAFGIRTMILSVAQLSSSSFQIKHCLARIHTCLLPTPDKSIAGKQVVDKRTMFADIVNSLVYYTV